MFHGCASFKVGGHNYYDYIKEFSIQSHQITLARVIRCGLIANKKSYGIIRNHLYVHMLKSMDRLLTLPPGSSGGNGIAMDHKIMYRARRVRDGFIGCRVDLDVFHTLTRLRLGF